MKVLVLSDLNWHPHLRSISDHEIEHFRLSDLQKQRYERINRYFKVVTKEKPDLVLFAGDITGDGSCGHGYQNAMKLFLLLLENQQIQSLFISGNHDPLVNYDDLSLFASKLTYSTEISNRLVTINGINVLGVSFRCSASKSSFNKVVKAYSENKIDICVAHAELKRRVRLFDTKAQLIVTGHYDRKLCAIESSHYISLDNDWDAFSYAVARFEGNHLRQSTIKVKADQSTTFSYQLNIAAAANNKILVNGQPALDLDNIESYPTESLVTDDGTSLAYLKFLRGQNYINLIETMRSFKNSDQSDLDLVKVENLFQLEITPTYKVSKHLIKDYVSKAFR